MKESERKEGKLIKEIERKIKRELWIMIEGDK